MRKEAKKNTPLLTCESMQTLPAPPYHKTIDLGEEINIPLPTSESMQTLPAHPIPQIMDLGEEF